MDAKAEIDSRRDPAQNAGPCPSRPGSCTVLWVNLTGLLGFYLSLAALHGTGLDPVDQTLLVCAATFAPIVLLDLFVNRVHARPSTGLDWTGPADTDWARLGTKLLGLLLTLSALGILYWSLPEYAKDFYAPFWEALRRYGLPAALLAPGCLWLTDRRMREPRDAYWHLGRWLLRPAGGVPRALLFGHLREWAIKGFFLPLMFVYLSRSVTALTSANLPDTGADFLALYYLGFDLLYATDLVFAATGYALALRLLDSQIRSSEPTVLGWVAALVCYQPFLQVVFDQYLAYGNDVYWDTWLAERPVPLLLWGCAILALLLVYALASATFGTRFSNLTHRGVLTNGPYRFSKHPAYIAKNLSWWMIAVPFLPALGWDEVFRSCLLLLGVNLIYLVRARTEERHLSWDPTYVRYALWINDHGLLAGLGRLLPALRYRPPSKHRHAEAG